MSSSKVWLVTGGSNGIGQSLVKRLLSEGQKVAVTSRNKESLIKVFGEESDKFVALQVELANEESVKKGVSETVAKFGTIDVVVNNAGYGVTGPVEDINDSDARANFDINVFGPLNVIRHTAPILREKRNGYIINISSVLAITTFPGTGIYAATKFALDGLTESLALELKPFNVKVLTVNPGYFRTEFLNPKHIITKHAGIKDYQPLYDYQYQHNIDMNGKQRGDPNKLAKIILDLVETKEELPFHLFVGPDSYELVNKKIETIQKDLNTWSNVATKTDFDISRS